MDRVICNVAGEWSACRPSIHHTTACGPGGLRTRTVTCEVNPSLQVRDDVAPTCAVKNKPPEMSSCFIVCDHHRYMYRWIVGAWSTCQPTSLSITSSVFGSSGLQCQDNEQV